MIQASVYGRAARDGELRQSQSGKSWCRVSIACEAGHDRESGKALTQWLTVVGFGRVAEDLAKVRKGETLSAIGRVEINRWTAQDGQEREGLQLLADAVVTARSARPGGRKANRRSQAPAADVPFNDNISF